MCFDGSTSSWLTYRIWPWHHSGPACRHSDHHMTAGAAGSCPWPARTGGGLSHLPAPCTENSHHTNQRCTHVTYSQCTYPVLKHLTYISDQISNNTCIYICIYLYLHVYEPTEEQKHLFLHTLLSRLTVHIHVLILRHQNYQTWVWMMYYYAKKNMVMFIF